MHDDTNHQHDDDNIRDAPLDAASQSLADALRASFQILKYIMMLLVVLYVFSGVTFLQPNEQAVVARLGEILEEVHDPGMLLAWPYPIDEVIRLPVKEASELLIQSHMLHLDDEEKSRGLRFVHRGPGTGLDPVLDGALLTADKGLVHVSWVITYKIDDLADYIRNLKGRKREAAEDILTVLIENAAIHVAAGLKAENVYRKQVEHLRNEVRKRVNAELVALKSGIVVTDVKVPESIVPLQVRDAFEESQRAENRRRKLIQDAQKERTRILNDAAGEVYARLIGVLDDIDRAKLAVDDETLAAKEAELEQMLEEDVYGEAGSRIKDAQGQFAEVVGAIGNDVKIYEALLPEYKHNPQLLLARLWDETRNAVLNNPRMTKIYRPFDLHQVRIIIGPDPEHERERERREYEKRDEAQSSGVYEVPILPWG